MSNVTIQSGGGNDTLEGSDYFGSDYVVSVKGSMYTGTVTFQSFNRTNDLNAAANITAEYAISTAIDPIAGSAPQFRHRNS